LPLPRNPADLGNLTRELQKISYICVGRGGFFFFFLKKKLNKNEAKNQTSTGTEKQCTKQAMYREAMHSNKK